MNQRERDALRNEHTKVTGFIGNKEIVPYCLGCGDYIDDDRQPYPCDVIKVLDALESRNGLVNPARMDTCTHYGIDSGGTDYYGTSNPSQEADWNYAYCPNCGEKL